MSSASPRNCKPSPYVCGKATPPQPGDEQVGEYSRERLIRMNDRFVERMESAISRGLECPPDGAAPERAA